MNIINTKRNLINNFTKEEIKCLINNNLTDNIPKDSELYLIFKNYFELKYTRKYKIFNMKLSEIYNNSFNHYSIIEKEKSEEDLNDFIIEEISFFKISNENFISPLLIYYDLYNIKYENYKENNNILDINKTFITNEKIYKNIGQLNSYLTLDKRFKILKKFEYYLNKKNNAKILSKHDDNYINIDFLPKQYLNY